MQCLLHGAAQHHICTILTAPRSSRTVGQEHKSKHLTWTLALLHSCLNVAVPVHPQH